VLAEVVADAGKQGVVTFAYWANESIGIVVTGCPGRVTAALGPRDSSRGEMLDDGCCFHFASVFLLACASNPGASQLRLQPIDDVDRLLRAVDKSTLTIRHADRVPYVSSAELGQIFAQRLLQQHHLCRFRQVGVAFECCLSVMLSEELGQLDPMRLEIFAFKVWVALQHLCKAPVVSEKVFEDCYELGVVCSICVQFIW
jgi:hypothetical protein